MFIFVSGGASSGKSEWAEQTALSLCSSPRIYLATAHVAVSDFDMQRRVARHRERRQGRGFLTLERERNLAELVTCSYNNRPKIPQGSLVLLECLPNWLANEMLMGDKPKSNVLDRIPEKIMNDVRILQRHTGHLIIVSDDVFSDGMTYDTMTESYLRLLGRLHVQLAAMSDVAVECVSGLVHFWKGKINKED